MTVGPLLTTAALAFVSVTLWTFRVALTAAGKRGAGAAVAGIEAITFVYAFARIVQNLDSGAGVLAYGLGVAAGTMVGVILDERLSTGQSWVHVFVRGDGATLAERLATRRWPVTTTLGQGPEGPVAQLAVAVDDADLDHLTRDLDELAPGVFWTSERMRHAHSGTLPAGLRQVGARRMTAHPRRHSAHVSIDSAHGAQGRGRRGTAVHRRARGRRLPS